VDVTSGSGTASVVVTAADGTTKRTYTIDITVLPPSGIEDALAKAMRVYPTVSNGIFNVEFAGNPGMITVYDYAGKMVEKRKAGSKIETILLDEAGIYLFRLESENGSRMVRVISVK